MATTTVVEISERRRLVCRERVYHAESHRSRTTSSGGVAVLEHSGTDETVHPVWSMVKNRLEIAGLAGFLPSDVVATDVKTESRTRRGGRTTACLVGRVWTNADYDVDWGFLSHAVRINRVIMQREPFRACVIGRRLCFSF